MHYRQANQLKTANCLPIMQRYAVLRPTNALLASTRIYRWPWPRLSLFIGREFSSSPALGIFNIVLQSKAASHKHRTEPFQGDRNNLPSRAGRVFLLSCPANCAPRPASKQKIFQSPGRKKGNGGKKKPKVDLMPVRYVELKNQELWRMS